MTRIALLALLILTPSISQANSYRNLFTEFELENNYGKTVAFKEFQEKPIIVLAFIGTECPLAKLYGPKLKALDEKYRDRGVVILGISSNTQDSLTELTAYVHRYEIDFPVLKDLGNRLADKVQATRTPEVFVFDQQRELRYHGRIDDQYGVGYSRYDTKNQDLANAIEALLNGEEVPVPETKAVGCVIGRVKKHEPNGEITFTKHVAPILNARCVSCHREGEIGPFTLKSYEDVQGWEETILEVIEENRMPPWGANPDYGHFSNDARLSDEEKATLRSWVANGMPEGDPSDLPEPPKFVDGWRIPEPDQVVLMREKDKPFQVPAEGVVDYKRFIIDPEWKEDKYIYAAEARPQNRAVVHHILVYIIPPRARNADLKRVLVGYAPGNVPIHYKDGLALKVPAGSKLLFEMHYTPNGSPQEDLSYAGVCFIDKEDVTQEVSGELVATHRFAIPPGEANYEVTASSWIYKDCDLLSMTPHMHLRGKAFRYEAKIPGKDDPVVLLDVPKYDFNWQLKYILKDPLRLPRGTKIICKAVFDNSEDNLVNPDPTKRVFWGDQSWDEMMIGFMTTKPAQE
ncbi:MAG: redoxin domain-containing protein [Planctomycetota bacterium]